MADLGGGGRGTSAGTQGPAGADGDFIYLAFAIDANGTGFSETDTADRDYFAIKRSAIAITTRQASDFTGLWRLRKGSPGQDGNKILYGTTDPANALGNDDDFYIKLVASVPNMIFGPKGGGVWPSGVSMIGPQGDIGPNGTAGIDGLNGVDGKTLIYGSGAPTNGIGNNGDSYIDTTNKMFYANKTAGAWGAGFSIVGNTGSPGSNGTNGSTILYGSGAPSNGLGVNGDSYLDTAGMVFYSNKTGGVWSSGTNLVGATGVAGAQGNKSGMIYQYGSATGNADPSDGKFRLDTASTATPPSPTITVVRLDEKEYGTLINMDSRISVIKVNDHLDFRSNSNSGTTFFRVRVTALPVKVGGAGGYWNVGAAYVSGAIPLTNGEILAVTHIPGTGIYWDGTDLVDESGNTLSNPLTYNTMADVPAASSSNNGKNAVVLNPGNNDVGIPITIQFSATRVDALGGRFDLARKAPLLNFTCPAATFTSVTASSAASGADTLLTSAGVHGLTAASAVGAYIYISAGTGWTAGFHKITAIAVDSTGTTIQIDTPFASQGSPTIALANTEVALARIKLPALTDVGGSNLDFTVDVNGSTSAKTVRVRHTTSGGADNSGTIFWTNNETTNAPITRAVVGFTNTGATNVQEGTHNSGSLIGLGNVNSGTTVSGAIQTNVSTDLMITAQLAAANDVAILKRYMLEAWL